jgi:hypothetical protein
MFQLACLLIASCRLRASPDSAVFELAPTANRAPTKAFADDSEARRERTLTPSSAMSRVNSMAVAFQSLALRSWPQSARPAPPSGLWR